MLSEAERDRVEAAVRAAEAGTAGEIVVVLARQAASYRSLPLLYGLLAALATPLPLVLLTRLPAVQIFAAQLLVATVAVGAGVGLGLAVVPGAVKRARARAAAAREFVSRGMSDTRGRTGILLYVAKAERYAEVVGDVMIAHRVGAEEWRGVIEALTAAMAAGRTADALEAAIARIGVILARHVPPEAEATDELPNRIVVL